ncbi:MAG: type II toxin-antitoxin system HicA family toxin, partial [Firmicutes bacterium]|nr:type II toxin-antitoxin system HicA family toxin [Bacillota bacterium]
YGYQITRQTGSHLRLTTEINGIHHITIPRHHSIKLGTLSNIIRDVANHLQLTKRELTTEIFKQYKNPSR